MLSDPIVPANAPNHFAERQVQKYGCKKMELVSAGVYGLLVDPFRRLTKPFACLIGFMADVDGEVYGWGHSLFTGFATARR